MDGLQTAIPNGDASPQNQSASAAASVETGRKTSEHNRANRLSPLQPFSGNLDFYFQFLTATPGAQEKLGGKVGMDAPTVDDELQSDAYILAEKWVNGEKLCIRSWHWEHVTSETWVPISEACSLRRQHWEEQSEKAKVKKSERTHRILDAKQNTGLTPARLLESI